MNSKPIVLLGTLIVSLSLATGLPAALPASVDGRPLPTLAPML